MTRDWALASSSLAIHAIAMCIHTYKVKNSNTVAVNKSLKELLLCFISYVYMYAKIKKEDAGKEQECAFNTLIF
jgi:HD superfamily phosphohydrolase